MNIDLTEMTFLREELAAIYLEQSANCQALEKEIQEIERQQDENVFGSLYHSALTRDFLRATKKKIMAKQILDKLAGN